MTDINQSVLNKLRKNKFLLVLTLPPILKDKNTSDLSVRTQELINLDTLQFSVFGSLIPKISIPAVQTSYHGQTYNVNGQTRAPYEPITVNFTVDNKMNNYWVLWKWLEVLNHQRESGMPEYFNKFKQINNNSKLTASQLDVPNNVPSKQEKMINNYLAYQTQMTAYMLDEYNQRVAQIDYHNSFITDLGELRVNNRDPEEIECSFTFVFNQLDIKLI